MVEPLGYPQSITVTHMEWRRWYGEDRRRRDMARWAVLCHGAEGEPWLCQLIMKKITTKPAGLPTRLADTEGPTSARPPSKSSEVLRRRARRWRRIAEEAKAFQRCLQHHYFEAVVVAPVAVIRFANRENDSWCPRFCEVANERSLVPASADHWPCGLLPRSIRSRE